MAWLLSDDFKQMVSLTPRLLMFMCKFALFSTRLFCGEMFLNLRRTWKDWSSIEVI